MAPNPYPLQMMLLQRHASPAPPRSLPGSATPPKASTVSPMHSSLSRSHKTWQQQQNRVNSKWRRPSPNETWLTGLLTVQIFNCSQRPRVRLVNQINLHIRRDYPLFVFSLSPYLTLGSEKLRSSEQLSICIQKPTKQTSQFSIMSWKHRKLLPKEVILLNNMTTLFSTQRQHTLMGTDNT